MKKFLYFLPLLSLILSACGKEENEQEKPDDFVADTNEKYEFTMSGDEFVAINFADLHINETASLSPNSIIEKTIRNSINENKPNIITFSGDNCWTESVLTCYKALCDFMDEFEIPYFFILGNHDRETTSASQIFNIINKSKFGHFTKGSVDDNSYGNYTISIRNRSEQLLHKILMMDSRDYCTPKEEDYSYVESPVNGVYYSEHFNPSTQKTEKIYGYPIYDGIRDKQIDWYKNEVNENVETTLIAHMPIIEYTKAIEQYLTAKENSNQELINQMQPIGNCSIKETVCSCVKNYGLFDTMKTCGSTKNMICGHEHVNDFSLVYDGIRLTYAVKTGNLAYWDESGQTNGCTKLKIDATGAASISQYYYIAN